MTLGFAVEEQIVSIAMCPTVIRSNILFFLIVETSISLLILALIVNQKEDKVVPVKRKSRGRSKGSKGRSDLVQCSGCGGLVPSDKAKKISRPVTLVEPTLARELRQRGAYMPMHVETKYYCVSCAVHRGVVKVRARNERRTSFKRRPY